MGEHSIIQIAEALQSGLPVDEITFIPGTVYKCKDLSRAYDPIILPSYETVSSDKKPMPKALPSSTEIPTRLLPDRWQRATEIEDA